MPTGLCHGGKVPLAGLFISHNNISGALDVSDCLVLQQLDASYNGLTGNREGATPRVQSHDHHAV